MSRGGRDDVLVFRGPPQQAVALFDAVDAGERAEVRLEGVEVHRVTVRSPRPDRPLGRARLRLAGSTPPGRYDGSAVLGEQEVPVVVEVEPVLQLEALPPRLALEAEPGGDVTVEVTLHNAGNVPAKVRPRSTFCLFDGSGFDHAFWAALAAEPPEGKGRADVFMDDLATSHGGLVEARVPGRPTIAPGEARTLPLTLSFSERLRPDHVYAGAWEIEGLRVPVRVRARGRPRGGGIET